MKQKHTGSERAAGDETPDTNDSELVRPADMSDEVHDEAEDDVDEEEEETTGAL